MVNAAAEGEEAFEAACDLGFDNLGDVDGREQIDRHAYQAADANDGEDQTRHHDEIRVPDRKSRHYCAPCSVETATVFGWTASPSRSWLRALTTTKSSGLSPEVTSTRSDVSRPVCTFTRANLCCASTRSTLTSIPC